MEYNTSRNPLAISEYGRNVQRMVEYVLTIESKEDRTRLANGIISIMAQLNPSVREVVDYKHKLWDHLHVISDFKLDVDSPFPLPTPDVITAKPQRVKYPQHKIQFKFYGKNVEFMVKKAAEMEDGPEKMAFINIIGTFMKNACQNWNEENIPDDAILNHLEMLSDGMIKLDANSEGINFVSRERLVQHRPKMNNQNRRRQGGKNKNYKNFKKNKNQ